jgi:hypothetical protein
MTTGASTNWMVCATIATFIANPSGGFELRGIGCILSRGSSHNQR